ncbi:MAG TPA: RNA polymerase sigma factor [Vicinamibacterales bacterium]|nr:RNA polymerase sigma factor [Vicinamibacterales bacterium]
MASSLAWTIPTPWHAMSSADAPLTELDERALVQACLAGQPTAFDLIVERHRRPVYQLCYRFVGNHEDASDLSQDVFLRAFRGLRSFRGQSSLSTWLYRIAVNVCLNRVSSKAPLGKLTEPIDERQFVDEREESASDRLLRRERGERVRQAIAQLPRKQRLTLVLRMFHEMSHQEIADVLGSSVGAVKANFFHAMGNLKRILGDA